MEEEIRSYSPRPHDNDPKYAAGIRNADEYLHSDPLKAKKLFQEALEKSRELFERAMKSESLYKAHKHYSKAMEVSNTAYYYDRAVELKGGAVDIAFQRLVKGVQKLAKDYTESVRLVLNLLRFTELTGDELKLASSAPMSVKYLFVSLPDELRKELLVLKVSEFINTESHYFGRFVDEVAEKIAKKLNLPEAEIKRLKEKRALPYYILRYLRNLETKQR